MIKLISTTTNLSYSFETTIFPDGTSQIWKIKPDLKPGEKFKILWLFENETELFHVLQLLNLVLELTCWRPNLIVPYLPYARQDKDISNTTTFSRYIFELILNQAGVYSLKTFDCHSKTDWSYIQSESPKEFFHDVLSKNQYDYIIYPDKGAEARYKDMMPEMYDYRSFTKLRNQQTGEITGLSLDKEIVLGSNCLIIDDICDGGGTFIGIAHELAKYNPKSIDLAVSHGLFSKGKQILYDAGINQIFTTNSLLRNPDGFKICNW